MLTLKLFSAQFLSICVKILEDYNKKKIFSFQNIKDIKSYIFFFFKFKSSFYKKKQNNFF